MISWFLRNVHFCYNRYFPMKGAVIQGLILHNIEEKEISMIKVIKDIHYVNFVISVIWIMMNYFDT